MRLSLARTIDSATSDPEQLRNAIYELARQKLQQLVHDDPAERTRLMHPLEVAIAGVEAHSKVGKRGNLAAPVAAGYLRPPGSNAAGAPTISDTIAADVLTGPLIRDLGWDS